MEKKKVCICGHLGIGKAFNDGQTVKTRILYYELTKKIGNDNVEYIDTYNWKKNILKLLTKCIIMAIKCENIVVLPAYNGVKIFIPLFSILKFFGNFKFHYVVIGAWLPNYINENKWLLVFMRKVDCIHVETNSMINELAKQNICNVNYLPNFKNLDIIEPSKLIYKNKSPLRLCTFSRVMREKGITDLINVISKINKNYNECIYKLDVYGPINKDYEDEFNNIIDRNQSFVQYKGIVNFNDSVNILKEYFMLVFPTKYFTEGIPGTIIDAYSSGVPVLVSEWNSCREIVDDNITGVIYKFNEEDDLYRKLLMISKCPDKINNMKIACLEKAKIYKSDNVIDLFLKILK